MKRPPFHTRLIGHPAVSGPMGIATLAVTGQAAFQDSSSWPLAIFALLVMVPVSNANLRRKHYLAWKRQWEGMAEPGRQPAQPKTQKGRPWIGVGLLALLGLFFAANASDPTYALALVWLIVAAAISGSVAGITALVKRASKATPSRADTVAICVRGALLPVPDLRRAYGAVPLHCQRVLGR